MTAVVKSYELTEVAKKLNALAALDGSPTTLDLTPDEIALVLESRREAIRAWLSKKGIDVLRVKSETEVAVIVDPSVAAAGSDFTATDELTLRKRAGERNG